jgi:hypothetical protein
MGRRKKQPGDRRMDAPTHKNLAAKWRHNPPTRRPRVGERNAVIDEATKRFARGELGRAELMRIISAEAEARRRQP